MTDITLIGSSIFEFWGKPQLGELVISNQAIRSTQSSYWLDKAENNDLSHLFPTKNILVYCGSNDLIYGGSAESIINNVCQLLDKLLETAKANCSDTGECKIGYFSIMHCPQKQLAKQTEMINDINRAIEEYCVGKVSFFNFNDYIPADASWYVEDGLHLTEKAYSRLNEQLTPVLNNWVKA